MQLPIYYKSILRVLPFPIFVLRSKHKALVSPWWWIITFQLNWPSFTVLDHLSLFFLHQKDVSGASSAYWSSLVW